MELNFKLARPIMEPARVVVTPPAIPLRDQVWEVEETQVVKRQISLPALHAQLAGGLELIRQYQSQIALTLASNGKIETQIEELTAHIDDVQKAQDEAVGGGEQATTTEA